MNVSPSPIFRFPIMGRRRWTKSKAPSGAGCPGKAPELAEASVSVPHVGRGLWSPRFHRSTPVKRPSVCRRLQAVSSAGANCPLRHFRIFAIAKMWGERNVKIQDLTPNHWDPDFCVGRRSLDHSLLEVVFHYLLATSRAIRSLLREVRVRHDAVVEGDILDGNVARASG